VLGGLVGILCFESVYKEGLEITRVEFLYSSLEKIVKGSRARGFGCANDCF